MTTCQVCLGRAGKTKQLCMPQRLKQAQPAASPKATLSALVFDMDEEGESWVRTRQCKLKPVRNLEQLPSFHNGAGKHPKGPGVRLKGARRNPAVADALRSASLHRHRQRSKALGQKAGNEQSHWVTESESLSCYCCKLDATGLLNLALGDEVKVRHNDDSEWLEGRVISLSPLIVHPHGWSKACSDWDEVRLITDSVKECEVLNEECKERQIRVALRKYLSAKQKVERRRDRDAKEASQNI